MELSAMQAIQLSPKIPSFKDQVLHVIRLVANGGPPPQGVVRESMEDLPEVVSPSRKIAEAVAEISKLPTVDNGSDDRSSLEGVIVRHRPWQASRRNTASPQDLGLETIIYEGNMQRGFIEKSYDGPGVCSATLIIFTPDTIWEASAVGRYVVMHELYRSVPHASLKYRWLRHQQW